MQKITLATRETTWIVVFIPDVIDAAYSIHVFGWTYITHVSYTVKTVSILHAHDTRNSSDSVFSSLCNNNNHYSYVCLLL